MSACALEGLQHVVASLPDLHTLHNIAVAENMLTKDEAMTLLQAIQIACDNAHEDRWVDVDLAYNAIQHPLELKKSCRELYKNINLNCGPTWSESEAGRIHHIGNSVNSDRRKACWKRFMHGPTYLLSRQLPETATCIYCSICQKPLNAEVARKNMQKKEPIQLLLQNQLWMHLKGKDHMRRSLYANGGDHIAQIPCGGGWSYFFSFTCGSQGWSRQHAKGTPLDECPFVRHPDDNVDHDWAWQPNEYPDATHSGSSKADLTHSGSSKADLEGILRALRNNQLQAETDLNAKDGIPGLFPLPHAFEAEVQQVKLRFCWKDYLEHQFGRSGMEMLQPSEAFLQVHDSARSFVSGQKDEPPFAVYLTVVIRKSRFHLHLSSRRTPLIALKCTGMLVGRLQRSKADGGWDWRALNTLEEELFRRGHPAQAARCLPRISASKREDVINAFSGSSQKLNAIRRAVHRDVRSLRSSPVDYLRQCHDKEPEDVMDRVHLDLETHLFEPDAELRQGFFLWLQKHHHLNHTEEDMEGEYMECLALGNALWDFRKFVRTWYEQDSPSYYCPECRRWHCKWAGWDCLNCEYEKELVIARTACDRNTTAVRIQQNEKLTALIHALQSFAGPEVMWRKLEEHLWPCQVLLTVQDLRCTHDEINWRFRNGDSFQQLINELKARRIDLERGELLIQGAYYNGAFRSISNRRVKCLWEAFQDDPEQRVLVDVFPLVPYLETERRQDFLWKFHSANSTQSDGRSVVIRGTGVVSRAPEHVKRRRYV